jgi:hypothetical protein
VLRLPKGWQLCTCRHDEYGPLGLPDFWVEALGPFLNLWLGRFVQEDAEKAKERHAVLERALGQVVAGYDAFPRGEIKRGTDRKHFVVRHGGDIARNMRVSGGYVVEAFGIRGRAMWVDDKRLACDRVSARRLRDLFSIAERWEKH